MSNEIDDDDPLVNRSRTADLERIKNARKKRISQLKSWQQYDKLMEKNKTRVGMPNKSNFLMRRVRFPQSMVLLEAAGRGDIDEVNQILLDGANPDVCNDDGLTALHQCCIDNSLEICRLLLQYNVNVNATDSELWTPLHAAAACAHSEICGCLIEKGADLLALNAEGNMPYDICEDEDTLDLIENAMATQNISQEDIDEKRKMPEINMLQELQSRDLDLSRLDEQGANYLHIAASCGFLEVAKFLLDCGVSVEILDKDGWQPIHVAACWGQLEFIELMLLRGADINSATRSGETIYEICEDPEMNEKLQIIRQEIERQHEMKKIKEIKPIITNLNRRSTSSKRSGSVRRSSMREKSLMSWKEARQEALIKEAVEKQVSVDISDENLLSQGSFDNRTSIMNEEIDIDQVLLDVQIVAENELAKKEPFIRRGSSRNSFTHLHPYHSPTRDPSLLEPYPEEEAGAQKPIDEIEKSPTKVAQIPMNPIRISQRNGKNQPGNVVPVIGIATKSDAKKPVQQQQNNSSFIRNLDPNLSTKSSSSRQQPIASVRGPQGRKEIDNRLIKQQKTQGCCVVM